MDYNGLRAFDLLICEELLPMPAPSRTKELDHAFTLVEIMIVVTTIAFLAAIAVPAFMRARKRSQATAIKNDLRLIDAAVAQYAIETNKISGDAVYVDDWVEYIKRNTGLYNTAQDLFGHDYGDQKVDALPQVPANTWEQLSDVANTEFWSPYSYASAPAEVHRERRTAASASY